MPNQPRRVIHVCKCPQCRLHPYSVVAWQHKAINRVLATLDEKNRRRFVGLLAIQWGPGNIQPLAQITGLSRNTIRRGQYEIERQKPQATSRIRQPGGGRPSVKKNIPAS